ncbi:hypothetical protein [Hydrocoleum sp. CS-953]|uniref:hypothetical protein n=1 Tax=Hydrocoleum sp. CS-953 TaxID=1671698 RepID=UPI00143CFAC9|nr:hypothetical protein [Hydrocoleum sp. CS-953]
MDFESIASSIFDLNYVCVISFFNTASRSLSITIYLWFIIGLNLVKALFKFS